MKAKLLTALLILSAVMVQSQTTAIPDPNFEQRLIDMMYDTLPIDGMVPTTNIDTVTNLIIPNSNILDLTGIEDFAALEILDITGNGISNLNISNNTMLRELYAETNPLGILDVSFNPNLEILRCGYTQLTELDISNNSALSFLSCNNNQLCYLDLNMNTLLTSLGCSNNQLTYLNVRNGTNNGLTAFNATANDPSLCIEVDDEVAATAGTGSYATWQVDAGASFSENCAIGPDMTIYGNAVAIINGDNSPDTLDDTDFGSIEFGQFVEHTFTIENTGDLDLNLSGVPLITITNSTDFTVIQDPVSVISSTGGTTTFILRYEPSMAGTINTATISIDNDDCDDDPYIFDVRGESSTTLGIQNFELRDQIRLYPNPSQGIINLKYTGQE
ncbi:MAG: choice-of-anchor D domain-containing protein, partial [Bacteroidia bacterium]|nr:choice-of-anchor D domain-containing protein [Bacteroidia bacterium]